MCLPDTCHKQYDRRMEEKLRDENDTKDYDIFKEDLSSLEVVDENASKQLPTDTAPRKYVRLRSKRNVVIGIVAVLIVILLVVAGGFALRKKQNAKPQTTYVINTQSLDNGTLNKLTAETGSGKQQLTITPDTLFQNNVTINKDLVVKGQTFLQSPVTITKELTIGSNVGVGGNLSVTGQISAGNLNVGSVTITSLHLSGDLEFNGHLMPTGTVPTIKISTAGGGGSATIEGNDTVGTITITTGSNPATTGEMAIITFRSRFAGNAKVHLTPASNPASKLDYFVTSTPGFFTIETSSLPTTSSTYSFYYLVTQ